MTLATSALSTEPWLRTCVILFLDVTRKSNFKSNLKCFFLLQGSPLERSTSPIDMIGSPHSPVHQPTVGSPRWNMELMSAQQQFQRCNMVIKSAILLLLPSLSDVVSNLDFVFLYHFFVYLCAFFALYHLLFTSIDLPYPYRHPPIYFSLPQIVSSLHPAHPSFPLLNSYIIGSQSEAIQYVSRGSPDFLLSCCWQP